MQNQVAIRTAHRVVLETRFGTVSTMRVFNEADCDMAAMRVLNEFGGTIRSVQAVDENASYAWGEADFNR